MKKICYIFIVLAMCQYNSLAQKAVACLTDYVKPLPLQTAQRAGSQNCKLYVNIYIHFLRDQNQQGGYHTSKSSDIMTNLNNVYNQYNIFFNLVGYRQWIKPVYVNSQTAESVFENIFTEPDKNQVANAINIYVCDPNTMLKAGKANGIPSKELLVTGTRNVDFGTPHGAINYDLVLSRMVAHEVGHCLGLSHTFTGTSGNGDGDGLSDTSNDFVISQNCVDPSSCQFWTGPNCNMSTNPTTNMNNVMSYTTPPCMSAFSTMQQNLIRQTATTNAIIQGVAYLEPVTISPTVNSQPAQSSRNTICGSGNINLYISESGFG